MKQSKINFSLDIKDFKWSAKQQEIIDTSLELGAKMILVDGIWGSGKSLMATYACLKLLEERKISRIIYIRNIIQSGSGTLGWLGGDLDVRLAPYMLPFKQKLEELLPDCQITKLIKDGIIESKPVALLRGTSYNGCGIIIDEMGCMTKEDILLALSRVGKYSYVWGVGDSWQVDVEDSGFCSVYDAFNDQESRENKIFTFKLQEESDVMRSEFLKFVMRKMRL